MRLTLQPTIRIPVVSLLLLLPVICQAQSTGKAEVYGKPEALVADLYRSVSFTPGSRPDWSHVRSMFHEDALITLRVTRDSTALLSVDGFVKDFIDFIERAKADTTGFRERVVRMRPMVFGNIAHVLVLYEAEIPGSRRGPQQGVDSFQLAYLQGRWYITGIVNDVVTKDRPPPAELAE